MWPQDRNQEQYTSWQAPSQAYAQQQQQQQGDGGWSSREGAQSAQDNWQGHQNWSNGSYSWAAAGPSQPNQHLPYNHSQPHWPSHQPISNHQPQNYLHNYNPQQSGGWGGAGGGQQLGAFHSTGGNAQSWRRGNDRSSVRQNWGNAQNGGEGGRQRVTRSQTRSQAQHEYGPNGGWQQPRPTYDQSQYGQPSWAQLEQSYDQPLLGDPSWRSQPRFSSREAHSQPPPRFPSPPPQTAGNKDRSKAKGAPNPTCDSHSLGPSPAATPPGGRRKKIARAGPAPKPSATYLDHVNSERILPIPEDRPPLLVLDLNNTLLQRRSRSAGASLTPLARPYLSTFLAYVCGKNGEGRRRWDVAVYSSARSYNVLAMLQALELVPPDASEQVAKRAAELDNSGAPVERDGGGEVVVQEPEAALQARQREKGRWHARPGDLLSLVWSREWMGLSAREFDMNVETTKDLSRLWTELNVPEGEGVRRTILLDDEAFKASLQPHNHLPIEGFFVEPADFPLDPNAGQPRPGRSPSPAPGGPPRQNAPVVLAEGKPQSEDSALLSTIYYLSQLEREPNVAQFIRDGGIARLRKEVGGEEAAVECGRDEALMAGVAVEKGWRTGWSDGCK